jgi:hypothetical protein
LSMQLLMNDHKETRRHIPPILTVWTTKGELFVAAEDTPQGHFTAETMRINQI